MSAAATSNAIPTATIITDQQAEEVSHEEFCDVLEQAAVQSTTDLGSTIIHTVQHPEQGRMILIGTTARYAIVRL